MEINYEEKHSLEIFGSQGRFLMQNHSSGQLVHFLALEN